MTVFDNKPLKPPEAWTLRTGRSLKEPQSGPLGWAWRAARCGVTTWPADLLCIDLRAMHLRADTLASQSKPRALSQPLQLSRAVFLSIQWGWARMGDTDSLAQIFCNSVCLSSPGSLHVTLYKFCIFLRSQWKLAGPLTPGKQLCLPFVHSPIR